MISESAHQGGDWFAISSSGQTVAVLIKTGRRFERMALFARQHDIPIPPMTQILKEANGQSLFAQHDGHQFYP